MSVSKNKLPHISLVVIGHVDAGKSTTTGHLLYKCGGVDKRTMEKNSELAKELGKESFSYAFVMDTLEAERNRGITIDINLKKFYSKNYYWTVIDAPGHRDFIKNMLTGTSQADVAVLMVSSRKGEFEAGISPDGSTKEHCLLAYALGIRQLIVAVNKMDTHDWSEERFNEVRADISDYLTKVGFKADKVPFVPISGFQGENLTEKSDKCGWYKGPTFLECLDNVVPPKRPVDKPLRIPLQDVYTISGFGVVPVGYVESGVLKPNTKVVFAPGLPGVEAEVKTVEMHNESVAQAEPGDNIGFSVKGVAKKDLRRGMVCSTAKDDPVCETEEFVAHIILLDHPGQIRRGYSPVLDVHCAHVSCKFVELINKLDKKTGQVKEENPEVLTKGDSATVRIKPLKPLVVEPYSDYPGLGRFGIRDMGRAIGVGIVKSVTKKMETTKKSTAKKS